MHASTPEPLRLVGLFLIASALCAPAGAYELGSRWSTTATDGGGLSQGDPTNLTWHIIDDGTSISGSEGASDSDLVATFDATFSSNATWVSLIEDSFMRWSEIAGLTFTYEEADGGGTLNSNSNPTGNLGSYADIRVGGHSIDGASGANTLAYNYYPNHGDMVIDTDNAGNFASTSNNYRYLRNVVMHEIGHGLGIAHMDSSNAAFLLEPSVNTSFDGPQFDDILAIQRHYGDAWEKGDGNDTYQTATDLGVLSSGTVSIGTDAVGTSVGANDTDFISIDDDSDIDFFSFTIGGPSLLDGLLTPQGPTYQAGPQDGTQTSFDASAQSNLAIRVYDTDGSPLTDEIDDFGTGAAESFDDIFLPAAGTYFVQVTGAANTAQLYQLDLEATESFMPGDVNLDGVLSAGSGDPADDDIAAFLAGWRSEHALDDLEAAWMYGDLNLNGVTDFEDWSLLRDAFFDAGFSADDLSAPTTVPAPGSGLLAVTALVGSHRRRSRRS